MPISSRSREAGPVRRSFRREPKSSRGGLHAGTLSGSRWVVFLHLAGDAGACRASFAGNQAAGAGDSEGPRSELRQALCQRGAAVGPARAIAERLAASGVLRDPLGTPTDGAARL